MSDNLDFTMMFENKKKEKKLSEREVIDYVKEALLDKGYNCVNQLVGYMVSGDPTYITNHNNARSVITQYERDELLEIIIKDYLDRN